MKEYKDKKSEGDLEREARKRVRALREFHTHAATYVAVNIMLVLLNLLTSPEAFWAIWPMLGWGIGLAAHAAQVYPLFGLGGREWEERKVREYVLQRQHGLSESEVRKMLREEMQTGRPSVPSAAEWERMRQRLENLEAIVTSADWDRVVLPDPPVRIAPALDLPAGPEDDSEERAAELARRIH